MEPEVAASTSSVPIIGPVQLKETRQRVKAMKKMLIKPVVASALASSLVVQEAGSTSSKAPKKEQAKSTSNRKKMMLNTALVARLLRADAPNRAVTIRPRPT